MGKVEISGMIRKLVPIFFSAAVLSILFLVFWQRSPGPRLIEINQQMEVDMNIREFSMVQGQEGVSSWELFSDNAGFLEDKKVYTLDNPVITYHLRNSSGSLVIRSSKGLVLQEENIVRLWPDVRAEHGEITVNSDKATYMGGDNHILLEDNVVFRGRGIIVNSPRSRINLDDEQIVSTGGVRTLVQ